MKVESTENKDKNTIIKDRAQSIRDKIITLRKLINKHSHMYHTEDAPEISDETYDALLQDLELLQSSNLDLSDAITEEPDPINRVGDKVMDGFKKVRHATTQMSYEKAFNIEDIRNWEERNIKILDKNYILNKKIEYICELKIDGLKLILTYKNGSLVQAATRGDGEIGEDVINNALNIKDIPRTLKHKLNITVTGEIWMEKSELETINNKIKSESENKVTNKSASEGANFKSKEPKLYANARNLAAGTLRQLDPVVVKSRNLKFFAYALEGTVLLENKINNTETKHNMNTQSYSLLKLKELGFVINEEYKVCGDIKAVEDFYKSWTSKRKDKEYAIDGVVVKIDDIKIFEDLGYTSKAPRGGIAYKFPAEVVVSTVLDIITQVGRTGVITPVALLSPVALDGSIVSRATLHNVDEIKRLGIRIGDTVELRKAGDVIPEIFNVILDLRHSESKEFVMSNKCPSCGSTLDRDTGKNKLSVAMYCKNKSCPAKHIENLIHFVSRKAINIEMLGDKIVEDLVSNGYIKDYASIYHLSKYKDELKGREGYGEKSIENLLLSIEKSRDVELHKFIFALGIRHVGETTAKDIAKYIYANQNNFFKIKSFDDIVKILTSFSVEDYLHIDGIGETMAESLYQYWTDTNNIQNIDNLVKNLTLIIPDTSQNMGVQQSLKGKTFVITGTLARSSREEAKSYIESRGGHVSESVSSKTNYLLAGSEAGSKLVKASQLGIAVISEEQLYML